MSIAQRRLVARAGNLHITSPGPAGAEGDTVRLTPIDDTTFVDPDGVEFTFVRNPAGTIKEVIAVGDGPAWRAERQP